MTGIIFTETGLFVGFFLPGDSLLVTAGLVSARGLLNVYRLGAILHIAAICGNSSGYFIGRHTGPRLFTRDESLLFKKKHLLSAEQFYKKHGRKTVVLAQFVPIIRTFAPVVAGAARMPYRVFLTISVLGTFLWVWSMLFTGYFLGRYIPGVDQHIEIVVLLVVFISILPGIISWWRERGNTAAATN
jgi:membrane-associated protein